MLKGSYELFGDSSFTMSKGLLQMKVLLVPVNGISSKETRGYLGDVYTEVEFEDPEETITATAVFVGETSFHSFKSDNTAVGVVDCRMREEFGVLRKGATYFAFLLSTDRQTMEKMETDGVVEVKPRVSIGQELTTIRLGNHSKSYDIVDPEESRFRMLESSEFQKCLGELTLLDSNHRRRMNKSRDPGRVAVQAGFHASAAYLALRGKRS
jgi:hypothetical protein